LELLQEGIKTGTVPEELIGGVMVKRLLRIDKVRYPIIMGLAVRKNDLACYISIDIVVARHDEEPFLLEICQPGFVQNLIEETLCIIVVDGFLRKILGRLA